MLNEKLYGKHSQQNEFDVPVEKRHLAEGSTIYITITFPINFNNYFTTTCSLFNLCKPYPKFNGIQKPDIH